ncbi:MAG: hypothetical protein HRU15_07865, partial [Planctomycetes bacterium]|nr:hypothetical protein [Planctomycetota bacterium]
MPSQSYIQKLTRLLLLCSPITMCGHIYALEQEGNEPPTVDNNAGHELDLFMDLPMVISASRQAVPLHKSSAAVTVVDNEDLE